MKTLGTLYVIAAPSGAGKTSLVNALLKQLDNIMLSISYTTRSIRPGEKNGVEYHFVDLEAFQLLIAQGVLLEYAQVFGHYYGTSRHWVEQQLAQGKDVLLEIDWQGAQQIRKQFPQCLSIFILPPSFQVLQERLYKRNQDKPEVIARRLAEAKQEMMHHGEFDYLLINDVFEQALQELATIIKAQRLRTPMQAYKHVDLLADLLQSR